MKNVALFLVGQMVSSFIFYSCSVNGRHAEDKKVSTYQIQLSNHQVDSVLSLYLSEHKVDSKKSLITLRYHNDGVRHFFYISQARRDIFTLDPPDHWFLHKDNTLGLLFLGGNKIFVTDIAKELQDITVGMGIALSKDKLDFNPPSWEVLKDCDNKIEVRRQPMLFLLDYLPCGYSIKQDSVNFGNYEVIKK